MQLMFLFLFLFLFLLLALSARPNQKKARLSSKLIPLGQPLRTIHTERLSHHHLRSTSISHQHQQHRLESATIDALAACNKTIQLIGILEPHYTNHTRSNPCSVDKLAFDANFNLNCPRTGSGSASAGLNSCLHHVADIYLFTTERLG